MARQSPIFYVAVHIFFGLYFPQRCNFSHEDSFKCKGKKLNAGKHSASRYSPNKTPTSLSNWRKRLFAFWMKKKSV